MSINLPKWMLNATSDTHFSKYPMFIQYKPAHHKVKGYEVRQIIESVQPGDILLRKYNGYLNDWLTDGWYSHAGLYVGEQQVEYYNKSFPCVVHAVGQGVIIEDILDFCRTDSLCILRVTITINKQEVVKNALKFIEEGIKYDYRFKSGNTSVYCTEMVDICLNNIFKDNYVKQISGHTILLPDYIYNSGKVNTILEFRH